MGGVVGRIRPKVGRMQTRQIGGFMGEKFQFGTFTEGLGHSQTCQIGTIA